MTANGLPSKQARELHRVLTRLGYTLERQTKHLIYTHPDHPIVTVPATPSDWRGRANDMATLKRRHPEAFRRNKKAKRRQTKSTVADPSRAVRMQRRAAALRASVESLAPRPRPVRVPVERDLRVRFYRCRECAMPWRDEAFFAAQSCTRCGSSRIDVNPPRREAA